MKFSKNGKYLATAGQDTLVRVWEVVLQRDERGLPAATPSSPGAPRDERGLPAATPSSPGAKRDERGLPAATPSSPGAPRGAPAGDGAAGARANGAAGGGGGAAGGGGGAAGGAPASGGVGEGRDGCEGGAAAADGALSHRLRLGLRLGFRRACLAAALPAAAACQHVLLLVCFAVHLAFSARSRLCALCIEHQAWSCTSTAHLLGVGPSLQVSTSHCRALLSSSTLALSSMTRVVSHECGLASYADIRTPVAAGAECPEAVVLRPAPHRCYAGHDADVLDVAWSRSQFLLSASMDKTVRLWHISMDDCLRVFRCAAVVATWLPGWQVDTRPCTETSRRQLIRLAPVSSRIVRWRSFSSGRKRHEASAVRISLTEPVFLQAYGLCDSLGLPSRGRQVLHIRVN